MDNIKKFKLEDLNFDDLKFKVKLFGLYFTFKDYV